MTRTVASICLYGNDDIGTGYLAHIAGREGLIGDGEPTAGICTTESIGRAQRQLREAGVTRGRVRIYSLGGRYFADVPMERSFPCYGDLRWKPIGEADIYRATAETIRRFAAA